MQTIPLAGVPRLRGVWAGAGLSALALALAAVAVQQHLDLHARYVALVLLGFLAGGGIAVAAAARHLEGRFGAANHVTLFRGALTSLAAGLVLADASPAVSWTAIAAAGTALLLDGVDGSLARRHRLATEFGARFDMETDAISILVLAALVWHLGKAGAWVLASGLLRYAFAAAGHLWGRLRAPLPPSRRRQAVCVVQIGTLLVCLVPLVPARASAALAAAALGLLAVSFAVDTLWLARHGGVGPG